MSEPSQTKPALVPQLRQLDHDAMLSGVPAGARYRVADRIAQEAEHREAASTPRRWIPALTFVAGAALVLLVVGLGLRPTPSSSGVVVRSLGAFVVAGDDCRLAQDADTTTTRGACRLSSATVVAQTWDEARVRPWRDTLQVDDGTVVFEVEHVPAGAPPVAVRVSHGTIEVLGTRFAIEQDATGGHVDLFEGRIRFVGDDGQRRDIAPGQRLGWGDRATEPVRRDPPPPEPPATESDLADEPAPAQEPRSERPARAPAPGHASPRTDEDAAAIVDEVESLRRQGRYAEAAKRLRDALRQSWSRRVAEVFSFELGTILARHLGDSDAACAHWRAHERRFGEKGRYAKAVADLRAACD